MIISFEDISVQIVTCFRCIRAPDVTPYPAQGKTLFYFKKRSVRITGIRQQLEAVPSDYNSNVKIFVAHNFLSLPYSCGMSLGHYCILLI
jgi:hypothetical protein